MAWSNFHSNHIGMRNNSVELAFLANSLSMGCISISKGKVITDTYKMSRQSEVQSKTNRRDKNIQDASRGGKGRSSARHCASSMVVKPPCKPITLYCIGQIIAADGASFRAHRAGMEVIPCIMSRVLYSLGARTGQPPSSASENFEAVLLLLRDSHLIMWDTLPLGAHHKGTTWAWGWLLVWRPTHCNGRYISSAPPHRVWVINAHKLCPQCNDVAIAQVFIIGRVGRCRAHRQARVSHPRCNPSVVAGMDDLHTSCIWVQGKRR